MSMEIYILSAIGLKRLLSGAPIFVGGHVYADNFPIRSRKRDLSLMTMFDLLKYLI